ncbi:MAG: hypothetical protein SFY66_18690 [Oculatellaceae cyanobacterium bins.114]|nr:hypothetical protein [Oculatellaceae cyanobacterium bins.114]
MTSDSLEILATVLGITSLIAGGIAWYRGSVQKAYAAEREMGHIKQNLQQLGQGLGSIDKELEELNRVIVEIKALILAQTRH